MMDEYQWSYDNVMSQEVDMDYENEQECGVNEPYVDCSDAFNTSQVFGTRDDVLQSNIDTGIRGRSSFVLIGCERSGQYKCRNKEFVRRDTGSRKCGCPFRLRGKPVHGGEDWMVKLICGIHNHELAKSLVGHPYVGRLTNNEKKIIAGMTKSMVKPKNILLTLKEHNANSCTTIKQIYNARSAYRSSIRGADTEMQHLTKLHEHSTYKTNRYKLLLLDFVGVTPTGMIFSAGFAYLEGEHVNNIVWALEQFRDLFLRNDRLPVVIVTDRDLALMNAVKTVFLECINLFCRFHIDKNVKAKCKSLIGQKIVWEYVMDNWGTLDDCPSEQQFAECLHKFQIVCSPWPMFVDYVNETWIIPHKEKFITAWTNKVMHLGNTTTNRVESAHWALKRVLPNSLGDLCSVWDAMNNMITLQHVEIKASFETSTHVVGHGTFLNEIAAEVERLHYLGNDPSSCGCVMRSTHGLPCAYELSRYTVSSIPVDSVHMFWRRLCFLDQGLCEVEVSIKEEIESISKRFEEVDVCGKVTLKSKLRDIAYPDQNSMCPPPSKVNTKGAPKKLMKRSQRSTKRDPTYWEYVDAFHSVQNSNFSVKCSASSSEPPKPTRIISMLDQFGFIHDIVDEKADDNCEYRSIAALLGVGEDSWPLVRNELIKELGKWSHDYINLFGGTERFKQLRLSLLVDGFSKVSVDKWMDIIEMGYVIASRYNIILVSLSRQQSLTFFPLRSQPPLDSFVHRMICVGLFERPLSFTASSVVVVKQFLSLGKVVPFTDTGNQIHFQCMQLINDDYVNTMLMCNDQFLCVGPIELLCTVGRTPDGIINLLERTMTPTHDALLYYNERWNMPCQNNFVGYTFTGKNPKKFEIPSGCTIDELKDLIKQVASQTVRRLFFRQLGHFEYPNKVIKFEIIELKTNDDVLKILVQSNYWKQFGPIEILAVFTKQVILIEDDMPTSLQD
ncbi:hypothetical protein HKD37_06G017087 [Glycine soja]